MLLENRYRHRDGSYRWLEWSATRVPDGRRYYAVARDVTERRAEQERLRAERGLPRGRARGLDRRDRRDEPTRAACSTSTPRPSAPTASAPTRPSARRSPSSPSRPRAARRSRPISRATGKAEGRIVEFQRRARRPARRRLAVPARAHGDAPRGGRARRTRRSSATSPTPSAATRSAAASRTRCGRRRRWRPSGASRATSRTTSTICSARSRASPTSRRRCRPCGPARERLEKVKRATERAVGLVDRLLAFGRRQALSPKVLDVNALIAELEHLVRGLMRDDVSLQLALDERVALVKADPDAAAAVARQPRRQRARGHARRRAPAHHDGERRSRGGEPAARRRRRARPLRAHHRRGQRRRHDPRRRVARLRAVLHDEGVDGRVGPRALDGVRHRHAERRLRAHRVGAQPRHAGPRASCPRSTRARSIGRGHAAAHGHGAARRGRGGRAPARAPHPRGARLQGAARAPRRRGARAHPPDRRCPSTCCSRTRSCPCSAGPSCSGAPSGCARR